MSGQYIVGLPVEAIATPALILDIEAFHYNLAAMKTFLNKVKTNIRPHAKTHKTPAIAHLQLQAGAIGICCATVGEAEIMAYSGIDNILIANEIIGETAIRRVVNLARQAQIIVAVDDLDNIRDLSAAACQYGANVDVLVDLDVGMGRCGARSIEQFLQLAKTVEKAPGLTLKGVLGYEGHVQFIVDRAERVKKGHEANKILVEGAKALAAAGLNAEIVSGAGTGDYDSAAEYPGITEIEAGSYIFMDGTYRKLDLPFKQSLTVLSTVLSRPTDDRAILDTGIKGISPERFNPAVQDRNGIEIQQLAEEHAIANLHSLTDIRAGDKLHLIPSHCCSTVNLYNSIHVSRKGIIEAVWPVAARRA